MNRQNEEDYNFYEDQQGQNSNSGDPFGNGSQNDPFGSSDPFGGQNQNQNQNQNQDYAYTVLMRPKTRVWSVLSVILAILSVICCCFEYVGLIFGVVAIVFAVISRKTLGYFETSVIVAIIIAIFGIILSLAIIVVGVMLVNSPEYQDMLNSLEEIYGMDLNEDGFINGVPVDDFAPSGPNEF